FDYDGFLENFDESKNYYFETLIQYQLSKFFAGKQERLGTAQNIEKIFNKNKEDILNDYRKSALEFLIFYLKNNLNEVSKENNVNTFIVKKLYEGRKLAEIVKEIPENILIETTVEEIFNEAKKIFIDLISFYPYDEKFYKLADIKFEYKLPSDD
ncbi:hypothetical protein, partial [Hydrogenivirga sp. 128-5-R1-1]|uniref:hypothetical protein n=1 Tax=Hydrogenivirga sp. 128-5-R1-1 TaxID=392423 RepID=UPI00015F1470